MAWGPLDWSTGKLPGSSHQRVSRRATLAAWVGAQAPKVDPTPPQTTERFPPCRPTYASATPRGRPRGPDGQRSAAPPSASPPRRLPGQQEATISILPGIVQPGRRTANADRALAAVVATFLPAKKGRAVELQRQDGSKWVTVATGVQDRKGKVEFAAPAGTATRPITYRAVAPKGSGLGTDRQPGRRHVRVGPGDVHRPVHRHRPEHQLGAPQAGLRAPPRCATARRAPPRPPRSPAARSS